MAVTQLKRDQFYLFVLPGDLCPVWAEYFGAQGEHMVAPTPYMRLSDALSALQAANPAAVVDELCLEHDIDQARDWARTMPLEQIEVAR